jgi:hypothetical protein
MLLWTQSANSPASKETGIINRRWQTICFCLEKHSLEQKLGSIFSAASAHESNALPVGAHEYQVLSDEATSLCEAFANEWNQDIDSLRAKIPGLAKLDALSTPKQLTKLSRVAWVGMLGAPIALFIIGVLTGLVSLGFHLVAGGR